MLGPGNPGSTKGDSDPSIFAAGSLFVASKRNSGHFADMSDPIRIPSGTEDEGHADLAGRGFSDFVQHFSPLTEPQVVPTSTTPTTAAPFLSTSFGNGSSTPSASMSTSSIYAASSAAGSPQQSSGLFSALGSLFAKRAITGSMSVELGTSVKLDSTDLDGIECLVDSEGHLCTRFDVDEATLSNVDQIVVQRLMLLYREAQKRLPTQVFAIPAGWADTDAAPSPSFADTSAPNLGTAAQEPSTPHSTYLQGLTTSLAAPGVNLNSNMEKAVEWALQARPLGYGYKGIGKLLRKISIITNPPHDLHLTHVPLFLHSVPRLEFLDMRNHSMTNVPIFTLFISSQLRTIVLSDNKIKTLFTEVPRIQLAGLIPPGTQATYLEAQSGSSPSKDASSSESGAGEPPAGTRKTDLLEHLTSSMAYFASLDSPPVEVLDLSSNLIAAIPPFISHLKHLHTLRLARNQLTALPAEVSSLPLTELIIDHNYIYELPALPHLEKLSWKSNGLKAGLLTLNARSIIASLSNAPKVTDLDLSLNSFDQPPLSVISLAPGLKRLSLASCSISTISSEDMVKFNSLTFLDLSSNRLKAIPPEMITVAPLTHLDLSDNQIATLPVPINPLAASLTWLSLAKNQLKSIPIRIPNDGSQADQHEGLFIKQSDIQPLTRLEHLNLSHNKLTEIPDMFEELSATLTYLDIANNAITSLPASCGSLSALRYLHAPNNNLEAVSPMSLMRSLEFADLQGNDNLISLPRTFTELHRLQDLLIGFFKLSRYHSSHSSTHTWKYDVQTFRPITDKAFAERLPQTLQLIRCSNHSLLLAALHYLCKFPNFHEAILQHNLLNNLLASAKLVPLSNEYNECFNSGQEQISSLIATRYLSKNLELRDKFESDPRLLITIISEHVIQQVSIKSDSKDPELYDAGGSKLGKSSSSMARGLDELGRVPSNEWTPETDGHSNPSSSSSSIAHSGSGHLGPRASRAVQLHRLQNKIRVSLCGLCLDVLCYLSWTQTLRTAINQTPALVDAVKALKTHFDNELSERSKRTLAGIGVAPEFKERRGVRILCLDGGGTRGFTAVVMLQRLEEKLGRPIHEYFDMVVGTSTGALIATLASWTRLSMAEAVTYYREACGIIFAPRGTGVVDSKYTAPVVETPQPNSAAAKIYSLAHELEPETFLKVAHPQVRNVLHKGQQALKLSAANVPLLDPSLASSSSSVPASPQGKRRRQVGVGIEVEPAGPPITDTRETSTDRDTNSPAHPAGISASWTGLSPWARVGGFFGMIASRSFYDAAALEMVLKNLGDPQATMLDTAANGDLRMVFTSTDVGVFPPDTYLLRNYAYKNDSQSRYGGCCHVKMWEAMRCTTAAPAYFDTYMANGHRLSDGGISTNNPTAIAIQEAKALWPDKPLDVVLSVGVGSVPCRPCPPSMSATFGAIIEGATETEQTHHTLEALLPPDVYYRLQPVDDVFDFPLDETKIDKLNATQVVLDRWLEENDDYFNRLAASLQEGRQFDDDVHDSLSKSASHYTLAHSLESDDEDIHPSPMRPIPSRSTIMDYYSPLDDLQQWDDDE